LTVRRGKYGRNDTSNNGANLHQTRSEEIPERGECTKNEVKKKTGKLE